MIVVDGFTDELVMKEKVGLHMSGGRAGISGWSHREANFKSLQAILDR